MNGARVVFLGTPVFATPVLKALVSAGYEIPLVITQPDRPAGRKRKLTAPPVKIAAEELGLQVLQPEVLRREDVLRTVRGLEVDVCVTAAYGQLLSQAFLDIPKHGCLNVHASLLPRWRGAAPIHRAIMAGDKETGVTIMEMVRKLDAGPMLRKAVVPIRGTDTYGTLHDELAAAGAGLLVDLLPAYLRGELKAEDQPVDGVTYAQRIEASDELVDFSRRAIEVYNHLRALSPIPGGKTLFRDTPIKVWPKLGQNLNPPTYAVGEDTGLPGTVRLDEAGDVVVRCKDGWLVLDEVQPASKRSMNALAWFRGLQSDSAYFAPAIEAGSLGL